MEVVLSVLNGTYETPLFLMFSTASLLENRHGASSPRKTHPSVPPMPLPMPATLLSQILGGLQGSAPVAENPRASHPKGASDVDPCKLALALQARQHSDPDMPVCMKENQNLPFLQCPLKIVSIVFFLQHVQQERLVLLYCFSGFKTNFAALWVELFNTLLFFLVFAPRSGSVFARGVFA